MSKRSAAEAGLDAAVLASSGTRREMQGSGLDGKKHSLDSDEEEEVAADGTKPSAAPLPDEDIDGQEEPTIARDGEISITPFNLKEEQEEGHFSADGNFVWKKEKEIVDSWLDNVDWVKVEERSQHQVRRREEEDEEEDEAEARYDEAKAYGECLELMREGETVAKAIRRLSGGKKAVPKWKKAKKKEAETEEDKSNRLLMTKLTGLADSILSRSGNMEIYEETYEMIKFKLSQMKPNNLVIPEGVNDDDALDMFAQDLDSTKEASEDKPSMDVDAEVFWEFKWAGKDEVHGPHSSKEMLDWQTSGFFDKGVVVRKQGSEGEFLDVKRVDFDIYT